MFNPTQVSASFIHDKVKADIAQASDAWFIENQDARDKLKERIAEAGRKRKLISYSELVQGIKFECSTISPKPFEIHSFDWTGPQRRMIGHELARITEQTVEDAGCIITTIVVDKTENSPSKVLFGWLYDVGVLPDLEEGTVLAFWAHQVKLTHEYFKTH